MKLSEIMNKTDQELKTLLIDQRKALAEATIEHHTKQVTNVKQFAGIKRTIARTMTVLRHRELTTREETK